MPKCVIHINITVVVHKIFVTSIVRRINVDEINLPTMSLLQEFERSEIIALDEKVEFAAVVNKTVSIFFQDRQILFQQNVNLLPVFLEDEAVLLRPYFLLQFGGEGQQPCRIRVTGIFKELSNFAQLPHQILTMLFREIARAVSCHGGHHLSGSIYRFYTSARSSPSPSHRISSENGHAKRQYNQSLHVLDHSLSLRRARRARPTTRMLRNLSPFIRNRAPTNSHF